MSEEEIKAALSIEVVEHEGSFGSCSWTEVKLTWNGEEISSAEIPSNTAE